MANLNRLQTNIFLGEKVENLRCKVIEFTLAPFEEENEEEVRERHSQFIRSLFNTVNATVLGFCHFNKIYFIGDESKLVPRLQELQPIFPEFEFGDISDETLTMATHGGIIVNIIHRAIVELLKGSGFYVKFRKRGAKVAIPQFEKTNLDGREYSFIRKTKSRFGTDVFMVESFRYRFHLFPDGTNYFQIDPKITVLAPAMNINTVELQNLYLVPMCFFQCSNRTSCKYMTPNVLKFVQYSIPRTEKDCPASLPHQRYFEVLDLKKKSELEVPQTILFVEAHPTSLGVFREVKEMAQKSPSARLDWTQLFAKILSKNEQFITIPLGESGLKFLCTPLTLDITDGQVTTPLTNAKIIGEPRLIFSNEPGAINPKDGLSIEGPCSKNNAASLHHPSKMCLHVIYPAYLESTVRMFMNNLTEGCSATGIEKTFPGFKENEQPFFSKVVFAQYPQKVPSLIAYKSCVAAIKDKISKEDNVIVFVLPDDANWNFYHELKKLCYQHNLSSQIVRAKTLRSGYQAPILWNLGVALYAKAGGTPWKIGVDWLYFAQCYLGIQCKIQPIGKVGRGNFFVGSADIFNAFGEYLSCALHQGVAESPDGLHVDSEFMKNLVIKAVMRYKEIVGNPPQSIIIHRQVNFNNIEIMGLLEGLRSLKISPPCTLVHLQENHIFRGYYTGHPDLMVPRTTYFLIGPRNVILFTTGLTEGIYEGFGTPKATQINIRTINTDQANVESVCKGIIGFTRLRWNTTRVGLRKPLTIYAADRIGELVKSGYSGLEYRDIRDIL